MRRQSEHQKEPLLPLLTPVQIPSVVRLLNHERHGFRGWARMTDDENVSNHRDTEATEEGRPGHTYSTNPKGSLCALGASVVPLPFVPGLPWSVDHLLSSFSQTRLPFPLAREGPGMRGRPRLPSSVKPHPSSLAKTPIPGKCLLSRLRTECAIWKDDRSGVEKMKPREQRSERN
jgi:hypothetical protein